MLKILKGVGEEATVSCVSAALRNEVPDEVKRGNLVLGICAEIDHLTHGRNEHAVYIALLSCARRLEFKFAGVINGDSSTET